MYVHFLYELIENLLNKMNFSFDKLTYIEIGHRLTSKCRKMKNCTFVYIATRFN